MVTIFLSQPIVATDLVTAQVEDTVTLQPVLPASGLSACPGQDVTLNCTIVRMTTLSGVTPPLLIWQYRGDTIAYNNPSTSSDYYTGAVSRVTVMLATMTAVWTELHSR